MPRRLTDIPPPQFLKLAVQGRASASRAPGTSPTWSPAAVSRWLYPCAFAGGRVS